MVGHAHLSFHRKHRYMKQTGREYTGELDKSNILPVRYRWTRSYTDRILLTDIRRRECEGDGGAVAISGVSIAAESSGGPAPRDALCMASIYNTYNRCRATGKLLRSPNTCWIRSLTAANSFPTKTTKTNSDAVKMLLKHQHWSKQLTHSSTSRNTLNYPSGTNQNLTPNLAQRDVVLRNATW
jgi:hypothetical protein